MDGRFKQVEERVTLLESHGTDPWFDVKAASAHLGITPNALRKLVATRRITFEQDHPGCKMWFRRSALDAYRRGEMQR